MIKRLINFLDTSPVNFHAAENIRRELALAGFTEYKAGTHAKPGDKLYVMPHSNETGGASSIFAVRIGRRNIWDTGMRLFCAHCDSPTFRIKPNAEMTCEGGIVKLNTEVYGGPIMSTWFDRPLTIAGRVIVRGTDAFHPVAKLLHVKRPLLQISNLAIHFNRQVNDGVKLSKQKDVLPILGIVSSELERGNMLMNVICQELNVKASDILDFDIYLADATPACTFGVHDEFISSGRLDDLSMCYAGLQAFIADDECDTTQVLAIFDNEETGSQTKQGAGSPYLAQWLKGITGCNESEWFSVLDKSFMVSADNAHAWHPNYSEKYDPTNHPMLGNGPVIKFNAAQKYASDAISAAVFAEICHKAGVPCQRFVNHSDVAGGSTLGNILASSLPVRGVDMGNAILAMHSCRETGAVADHVYAIQAFKEFFWG